MRRGTVFMSCDFILDERLDEIQRELSGRGFEVVRGPRQKPPLKTEYPPQDWPRYFGRADLVVLTTRSIMTRAALEASTRLRAIVFPTIGTEAVNVLDANDLGLVIAHGAMPENFESMAEATVMLFAALFYGLHTSERLLRENRPRPVLMHARMLKGKTIGFVGLGRIGRGVAQRLAGWGVRLLAYDPYAARDGAPAGVTFADFDVLLRESDLVSVHATLSPETRHMLGEAQFARMRPGAFIVNTARGGLIDEDALYRALKEGRLAGAALDALEREPLPPDSPLRELDNVILTPHMVGHTREIFDAIPHAAIENIERLMRGERPLYARNPEVLPKWRERLAALQVPGR